MKLLLTAFLLVALPLFGAVPDYKSFRGTGGILISSNPPNGTIVIDGSGVAVSAAPAAPLSSVQFNSNGVMQGSSDLLFTNGRMFIHSVPTNGVGSPRLWINAGGITGNDSGSAIVAQGGGDAGDGVLVVKRHGDTIMPTMITGFGAYYTRAPIIIAGNFTATINDAQRVSVSDWGTGAGSPYGPMTTMLFIASDVDGPSIIMVPSGVAHGYHMQFLDEDYATVLAIEADGGLTWGGTTNAGGLAVTRTSIDTQLTRRRAAGGGLVMGLTNTILDQYFGARGITTGISNNSSGAAMHFNGGQGTGNSNGGAIFFDTSPSGSSGTATNPFVTAMTVTGGGRVGVATTTPDATVHIYGVAAAQGVLKVGRLATTPGFGSSILISDVSYPTLKIFDGTQQADIYVDSADHSFNIMGREAYPMIFHTATAERMRISSAGNVGIGTPAPSSALDVTGQVRMASSIHTNLLTFWPDAPTTRMHVGFMAGTTAGGIAAPGTNFGFFSHESGRFSLFRSGNPQNDNWTVTGSLTTSNGVAQTNNFGQTVFNSGIEFAPFSATVLTNILSSVTNLDFANQEFGGSESIPVYLAGVADVDACTVTPAAAVAMPILGSWSAFASNDTVWVRFVSVSTGQNPPAGNFRVTAMKFR